MNFATSQAGIELPAVSKPGNELCDLGPHYLGRRRVLSGMNLLLSPLLVTNFAVSEPGKWTTLSRILVSPLSTRDNVLRHLREVLTVSESGNELCGC